MLKESLVTGFQKQVAKASLSMTRLALPLKDRNQSIFFTVYMKARGHCLKTRKVNSNLVFHWDSVLVIFICLKNCPPHPNLVAYNNDSLSHSSCRPGIQVLLARSHTRLWSRGGLGLWSHLKAQLGCDLQLIRSHLSSLLHGPLQPNWLEKPVRRARETELVWE